MTTALQRELRAGSTVPAGSQPAAPAGAATAPPGTRSLDGAHPAGPGRVRAVVAGRWRRPSRPGWITAAIGLFTAILYSWNLDAAGYANTYYTAAVKSATVSWKAMFFASIDPGSFITVDKPPAALWLEGLSGRLFGFSTWSMLMPQVVLGVATVLILHHLVRRWRGDVAAHLAALALALTPIAAAMFRNNNPDALLTFLGVAAAWGLWNALESGRLRPLLVSAALTGLAFNTKMLQAFLVLPTFVLVYLVAGPPKLGRRLLQLVAALGVLVVSSGWWMTIVALWPAGSRPYIGSTDNNSIVSLLLGYNGLERIFGRSTSGGAGAGGPGGGAGGGGGGFGGAVGLQRMFNGEVGGLVSWLIPLALLGLVAGLWLSRRGGRTDRERAGWLLWGGWALTAMTVFSLSEGIFHPYYTVQLAPAIAALAGAGSVALWQVGRRHRMLRMILPAAIALSAVWSIALLGRTPDFAPWLRPIVAVLAALGVAGLVIGIAVRHRRAVVLAAGVAALSLLAGPAAYAFTTVAHPVSGSIVTAGPSQAGGLGGGRGNALPTDGGQGAANQGAAAQGAGGQGNFGGEGESVDQAVIDYLEANRGDAKFLVATFGSSSSAPIIIATGEPVITIGGFSGSDPAPTLAQFQKLVADGAVRFVLIGGRGFGGGGAGGGNGGSQAITSWVTSNGTAVNASALGGSTATLYDLGALATS